MSLDLKTVVKQLTDSGIIAPGKLEDFVPPKANPPSVEAMLGDLLKQHLLTRFQAQQVAAGKAKALILGGYTILDKIGAGGMGQVFKAEHRRMKRLVAIKMLPPAMLQDAAAVARFQREVEAAAKLEHANIVTAYDADQANGSHFLVMQYVDGQDLSALVKQNGPLPVAKAVDYVVQAARGLEFAHGEGVVHRDIKPANLLLDKKGVVKILDMGLARIEPDGNAAPEAELTAAGTVMGTVDYMAPEQALSTKRADARADIYSLGCTLYYLLTGEPPYQGESLMGKMLAHREQPIPSLQTVQTSVPKQVEALFRKMVAKNVDDRYQSMGQVVEALEALGLCGSETIRRGEGATILTLSAEERQRLTFKGTKKPLASVAEVVTSEKSKHLFAKIAGGTFATIVAPILVTFLMKYLDRDDPPPKPPAESASSAPAPPAPASVPVPPTATSKTSQPTPPVASDRSPGAAAANKPAPPKAKPATGNAAKTIDLLTLVDPSRDAVSGNWRLTGHGLIALAATDPNANRLERLQLPYAPPEEYDFEIDFTPTSGAFRIGQVVSAKGHAIEWEMDAKSAKHPQWTCGFSRLDGHNAGDSPESLKYDQPMLINGQRYRSRVEVRRGSLRALLDGKVLRSWTGDFSRFGNIGKKEQLSHPLNLGLIVFSRRVTFHKITVREVTGRGKFPVGVRAPAASGAK